MTDIFNAVKSNVDDSETSQNYVEPSQSSQNVIVQNEIFQNNVQNTANGFNTFIGEFLPFTPAFSVPADLYIPEPVNTSSPLVINSGNATPLFSFDPYGNFNFPSSVPFNFNFNPQQLEEPKRKKAIPKKPKRQKPKPENIVDNLVVLEDI